jgi:cytochrome P450
MTMKMSMRFFELLGEARIKSRPGMLRALIEAEIDGEPLPDLNIVGTIGLIVGGGFDTTTALTSETWRYLAEHPEDKARLLSGEEGIWDTATEEFLRYFSPSQGTARSIVQDAEICGYSFKAGERALVSFSMPNRDPRAFEDPDVLKIDRFPNRHAAFGLGNHRCIGSNLARVSFKAIMQEALARIPEYEIDYEGLERYEDAGTINGNKNMPMTFPAGPKLGPGLEATIAKYQQILDDEWAAEEA